jgi:hypothetical protein
MFARGIRHLFAVAFLAGFPSWILRAAEPKETAVEDPDFLVQGEYLGEVAKSDGKKKLGVQVIALGKGKFHAVWRVGGLPGGGSDKNEMAPRAGETAAGVTTFKTDEQTATNKNGAMVLSEDGQTIGELKRIVRKSPTLGAKPPKGAVVLFDGKSADQFENGRMTADGLLMQGATSKFKHQSGTLHIEFQISYGPLVPSRGNSEVRYRNVWFVEKKGG